MDLINKTSVIKKYQNGGSNELDPAVITDSFTGKGKTHLWNEKHYAGAYVS